MLITGNGRSIPYISQEQLEELQKKYQNGTPIDCEALKTKAQDSVEIKGITQFTMQAIPSENYNDINKQVTGLPASVFSDQFGYDMQKSIYNCMTDYYSGKISQSDVEDYFEECCTSMRIYRTQMRQTTGTDEEDNQQIVAQMYEMFAKKNAIAAQNANYNEGLAINATYGGRSDDFVYYNSDYYYKCEETKELLQKAAHNMTDKWEIPEIDTEEIEKNSIYTIDGGFDYNSMWNINYRNQVGRASMEDESLVPPENFKFFYKQNSFDGILSVSWNDCQEYINIPFSISKTGSLKGQIFNVNDLLSDNFKTEDNYKNYSRFLSSLTVFTRQYSFISGINNQFGDYIPSYN
ncbi:MAG: hypothetical protein HDR03_15260 [Lachnospiraceae bacterium]|nr:hypothetical protein [Lachnospiraceae bacterium]